ncbi:hypothetical protein GCM10007866_17830 [Gluconobacter albidus]|uniref:Uncharacterized protein n=1 Tax=Gluconobacter albidus TaxID=318683 RepID=A0ABQ5X238_9PROT|nr:hypothetical protein GCM10007866_17830 [Gluconobacter albidus]
METGAISLLAPEGSRPIIDLQKDFSSAFEQAIRLRTHSQNMTVAARQMAEKKTVGHLS